MPNKTSTKKIIQNTDLLTNFLENIYQSLYKRYGPQYWWPADNPFEIALGAILGQNTNWNNAEKALAALRSANMLSPVKINKISQPKLAQLIYSSGFYNVKAKTIKLFVKYLYHRFNNNINAMEYVDMDSLRKELLDLFGIGQETADDILLYIAKKPSFIIDSYTRRIVDRLQLSSLPKPYSYYKTFFMDALPKNYLIFGEYHALLIALAKDTCRINPICMKCCLISMCQTGKYYT